MAKIKKNMNPRYPTNRQDSTYDQLKTVYDLANKAGCYDAADEIKRTLIDPVTEKIKKGNVDYNV